MLENAVIWGELCESFGVYPYRFLLVSPLQALAAGGEAIAVLEQKVLDAKRALKDLDYETIDRLLQDLKEGRGTEETTGLIDDLLIESLAVETPGHLAGQRPPEHPYL